MRDIWGGRREEGFTVISERARSEQWYEACSFALLRAYPTNPALGSVSKMPRSGTAAEACTEPVEVTAAGVLFG